MSNRSQGRFLPGKTIHRYILTVVPIQGLPESANLHPAPQRGTRGRNGNQPPFSRRQAGVILVNKPPLTKTGTEEPIMQPFHCLGISSKSGSVILKPTFTFGDPSILHVIKCPQIEPVFSFSQFYIQQDDIYVADDSCRQEPTSRRLGVDRGQALC